MAASLEEDLDGEEMSEDTIAYRSLTDAQLWNRFKAGDRLAFSAMYQLHFSGLYNYGLKMTRNKESVKDHIQDLFIELWNRRLHLGSTDHIKLYLFTALRRKITDELNSKRSLTNAEELPDEYSFEFTFSPESQLILEQTLHYQREDLLKSLNQLPKRQKEALFLRYYEGMSCSEVASLMGVQLNYTYVLLSQALDSLRQLVNKPLLWVFFSLLS
jgi:RNA polymerase sigma factor (sigma-70 family)